MAARIRFPNASRRWPIGHPIPLRLHLQEICRRPRRRRQTLPRVEPSESVHLIYIRLDQVDFALRLNSPNCCLAMFPRCCPPSATTRRFAAAAATMPAEIPSEQGIFRILAGNSTIDRLPMFLISFANGDWSSPQTKKDFGPAQGASMSRWC